MITNEPEQGSLFESNPDWAEYWEGMPEYVHEELTPYREVKLRFASEEDIRAFEACTGLTVPKMRNWIWYPELQQEISTDKRVVSMEAAPDGS